jgi:hypothetical protein
MVTPRLALVILIFPIMALLRIIRTNAMRNLKLFLLGSILLTNVAFCDEIELPTPTGKEIVRG